MPDLDWSGELSAATVRLVRRELEWALQHQRDRLVRRVPHNQLALRTRQRAVLGLALILLAAGGWLWATQPGSPSPFGVACVVFAAIALVAVPVMPRYFAWTWRAIGQRLARRAERLVLPLEAAAPAAVHYRLRAAQLETRVGESALAPLALRDARHVIATPNAIFAFRRALSPEPIAIVCSGAAELVAALAAAGAAIERVDGPVARYGEWTALPSASLR